MPIVVKTLQMAALVLFGIVKIHFTGKIQYIWFVKDDPISDALALNDPKRFQIFFLILEETAIQYEIKYSLMIFFHFNETGNVCFFTNNCRETFSFWYVYSIGKKL